MLQNISLPTGGISAGLKWLHICKRSSSAWIVCEETLNSYQLFCYDCLALLITGYYSINRNKKACKTPSIILCCWSKRDGIRSEYIRHQLWSFKIRSWNPLSFTRRRVLDQKFQIQCLQGWMHCTFFLILVQGRAYREVEKTLKDFELLT